VPGLCVWHSSRTLVGQRRCAEFFEGVLDVAQGLAEVVEDDLAEQDVIVFGQFDQATYLSVGTSDLEVQDRLISRSVRV